jgi:hypothetical protein
MSELTSKQAYLAMFSFLDDYYQRTKSDDVGSLLGSMSLLRDGTPADPAIKGEWGAAVKRALAGSVDAAMRLTT